MSVNSSNSTQPTPVVKPKTHEKVAYLKYAIMGGAAIVFAVFFWWSLDLALARPLVGLPAWEQSLQFIISLAFFCVMLALFGVLAMAAGRKRWWVTAIVGFLSAFTLIPFFPLRYATLGAAVIMLAGFLLWSWNVAGDVASRKKFQPHYTIHAGFGTGLILLLIGVSMCYYTSLGDSSKTANQAREGLIGAARNGIDLYLPKQIPGYKGSMSLDEFLSLVATDAFGEYLVPQITQTLDSDSQKEAAYKQIADHLKKANPEINNPELQKVIQDQVQTQINSQRVVLQQKALEQLSEAQRQLLDEARREFLASFKIEAQGSDTMDTVIEKVLTKNVSRYVDPYQKLLPPLLALSFFFIIELISIVYRYVIFALAPVIAWVYRKFGLLHLTEKSATVQDLEV